MASDQLKGSDHIREDGLANVRDLPYLPNARISPRIDISPRIRAPLSENSGTWKNW